MEDFRRQQWGMTRNPDHAPLALLVMLVMLLLLEPLRLPRQTMRRTT